MRLFAKTKKNIIETSASALANTMDILVSSAVKEMQQGVFSSETEDITDKDMWSIYYDYLLYMMHIADRESYENLNDKMRNIFMDKLLKEVIAICIKDFDDQLRVKQFRKSFTSNFNLFQKDFDEYEYGGSDSQKPTENLTYMFAKRILKRLGREGDFVLLFTIIAFSVDLEISLNIPDLFTPTQNEIPEQITDNVYALTNICFDFVYKVASGAVKDMLLKNYDQHKTQDATYNLLFYTVDRSIHICVADNHGNSDLSQRLRDSLFKKMFRFAGSDSYGSGNSYDEALATIKVFQDHRSRYCDLAFKYEKDSESEFKNIGFVFADLCGYEGDERLAMIGKTLFGTTLISIRNTLNQHLS